MAPDPRSTSLAFVAAMLAAPVGGALGGLLSSVIVCLVSLPFEWPSTSFDPSLIQRGLMIGALRLSLAVPAFLVVVHALARGLPEARYGMLMGWGAFLLGGLLPYLMDAGHDLPLAGLVCGMACAWAFVQVEGRVRPSLKASHPSDTKTG